MSELSTTISQVSADATKVTAAVTSDFDKVKAFIATEVAKLKADEQILVNDLKAGSFTLKKNVLFALLGTAAVLGAVIGHLV